MARRRFDQSLTGYETVRPFGVPTPNPHEREAPPELRYAVHIDGALAGDRDEYEDSREAIARATDIKLRDPDALVTVVLWFEG